ncbi:MAG TPA: EAL domain-containing protein [Euzebya sp.]|nr:EAL domain-containing protein [Euzebya sp.]
MPHPTDRTARDGANLLAPPSSPGLHDPAASADLDLHHRLLAMIARDQPLPETLTAMCLGIEQRYPGAWCSVLLVSGPDQLRHVAAPSLAADYVQQLDGLPIGEASGACGTAAARGETVVVSDVLTDPLTAQFTHFWPSHGLRSVWSVPLLTAVGEVLGTFALYRGEVHTPDAGERAVVTSASLLGALAVERDRQQRDLIRAATQDALTGLPNRAAFMDGLTEGLHEGQSAVAVLFLDVDQFKLINDSLGHRAGDHLLIEVAQRLRDVVAGAHLVARFGGDEFAVLVLPADSATVTQVADEVESAFSRPFTIPGGEFLLTAALGITTCPAGGPDGIDADTMMRDADTAMYAAKAQRVPRVVFDGRLRDRVLARISLENALQRGIDEDEFAVFYQPVMDLRTGERTSLEALVRWTHPERGPLVPEEFIGLAEETGLIVPLGERVLDIAIGQAAALAAAGRPLGVAVNVSAIQLSDAGFADHVAEALDSQGLDPHLLVLELTESVAIAHGAAPRRALSRLSDMGVRLIIDDFGTGYSSIPLLRELPVVGLKVDRSFTMALDADPRMSGVVAAVTDLAHAMELFVVAEGVDTASALAHVSRLGCDYAQGFHISPPVPADQI